MKIYDEYAKQQHILSPDRLPDGGNMGNNIRIYQGIDAERAVACSDFHPALQYRLHTDAGFQSSPVLCRLLAG